MDKNYKPNSYYTHKQLTYLENAYMLLYDEYFELIKDQKGKSKLRKENTKLRLVFEISTIEKIIKFISYVELQKKFVPLSAYDGFMTQTSSSVAEISSGLQRKEGEDVLDWINRLELYLKGLITRHSLSQKDIDSIKGELPKADSFNDFYQEKAYIEMALEKNHIPEDINMAEWVIYKNQVQAKIKKYG